MRILFQGDSITDAGRDRSNPHHLGNGYPKFAAELLQEVYPRVDFEFLNFSSVFLSPQPARLTKSSMASKNALIFFILFLLL